MTKGMEVDGFGVSCGPHVLLEGAREVVTPDLRSVVAILVAPVTNWPCLSKVDRDARESLSDSFEDYFTQRIVIQTDRPQLRIGILGSREIAQFVVVKHKIAQFLKGAGIDPHFTQ